MKSPAKESLLRRIAWQLSLEKRLKGLKLHAPVKHRTYESEIWMTLCVSADEVRKALAEEGQCSADEIKVGTIQKTFGGLSTIWARCPLVVANKIVKVGKLRVGWTMARVETLADRPLQCHKCLEGGHTMSRCPSKADYSGRCYRCGETGHVVAACKNAAHCIACAERKFPAGQEVNLARRRR